MSESLETPAVDNSETEAEAVDSPENEGVQPDLPRVDTAFVILKGHDGSWRVTTDITQPFSIDRVASRADVRIGTAEINHLISHQDLATLVAATLKASEENS
jgi:hypothetical protein